MLSWINKNKKTAFLIGGLAAAALLIYKLMDDQANPEHQEKVDALVAKLKEEIAQSGYSQKTFQDIMEGIMGLSEKELEEKKASFKVERRDKIEHLDDYCRSVSRMMTEISTITDVYLSQVLGALGVPKEQFQIAAMQMGVSSEGLKKFKPSTVTTGDLKKILLAQEVALDQNAAAIMTAMIKVADQLGIEEKLGLALAPSFYCLDRLYLEHGYEEEDFEQLLMNEVSTGNKEIRKLFQIHSAKVQQIILYYQQRIGLMADPSMMGAMPTSDPAHVHEQPQHHPLRQRPVSQSLRSSRKGRSGEDDFNTASLNEAELLQYKALMEQY